MLSLRANRANAVAGARPARPHLAAHAATLRARWRVLVLMGVMAALAFVLYTFATSRAMSFAAPFTIAWPILAVVFTAAEQWRVYLHFRRNAHSFCFSEIPLVIGIFFADPRQLVLARVISVVIAHGLIRRHPPVKVVFNSILVVLQSECALLAVRGLTDGASAPSPRVWLGVLLILVATETAGTVAISLAVTLTEGAPPIRTVLQNWSFSALSTLVNGCVALEAVNMLWRNPWELWLLLVPIGTAAAASTAYATERRKHRRLQALYESTDLLRRTNADAESVATLLGQIRTVFHARSAEITILPVAGREDQAVRVHLDGDDHVQATQVMDQSVLEEVLLFVEPERRSMILNDKAHDERVRDILASRGYREGMAVALRAENRGTGLLLVGNRASNVNSFDHDDLQLFETMAAQAEAALEKERLGAELRHQAFHDDLTSLANRALFSDRVTHALARRRGDDASLTCVLFVDLDDFKMVNDSFGHAGGDVVLLEVAERLRLAIRPHDTAARIGGDEFAILLEETRGIDDAVTVAERIVDALRRPMTVFDRQVSIRASIGISSVARDAACPANREPEAVTAGELIARADMAMYRAKQLGKARFAIYEPGMHDEAVARLELKMELERAIERGELGVHYQPIVELSTGALTGVEALARWRHAERGMIPPDTFIPLAEDTGLVEAIGELVLERACRDARRWSALQPGRPPIGVSVNVSPRQLRNASFPQTVAHVLAATGLPAELLTLEITESWIVPDAEAPRELLAELKALGLKLAIDDFGTGYSSLSCLQYLPVDILKIAKPFIDRIAEDARAEAFALAIARLGKTLSLDLVAEGIETGEQRDRLLALRCDRGQGYYFSRPVPVAEIEAMLALPQSATATILPLHDLARAS